LTCMAFGIDRRHPREPHQVFDSLMIDLTPLSFSGPASSAAVRKMASSCIAHQLTSSAPDSKSSHRHSSSNKMILPHPRGHIAALSISHPSVQPRATSLIAELLRFFLSRSFSTLS
jgi:hypothetical protein